LGTGDRVQRPAGRREEADRRRSRR